MKHHDDHAVLAAPGGNQKLGAGIEMREARELLIEREFFFGNRRRHDDLQPEKQIAIPA